MLYKGTTKTIGSFSLQKGPQNSRGKISGFNSGLFCTCGKARKRSGVSKSFILILGFPRKPRKAWKAKKNFPSFPGFSLHVKNSGNFWLRMISGCHGSSTFRKAWKAKLGGVYSFMESGRVCLIWLDCNMPWLYRIVNENFVQ